MKLRNKKTGKIISYKELLTDDFIIDLFSKDINYLIQKLNKIIEEWEDYEEPEEHYFISNCGEVKPEKGHSLHRNQRIKIGNDFESK